jgi:hypothetical protein
VIPPECYVGAGGSETDLTGRKSCPATARDCVSAWKVLPIGRVIALRRSRPPAAEKAKKPRRFRRGFEAGGLKDEAT